MSIRKEQDRNESVSGLLAKVRNSATFLERQLEQVRQQKQRLQDQFSVLKRSLEQSDAELASVEQEKVQVLDQTAKVDVLLIKTQNETHKMEERFRVEGLASRIPEITHQQIHFLPPLHLYQSNFGYELCKEPRIHFHLRAEKQY